MAQQPIVLKGTKRRIQQDIKQYFVPNKRQKVQDGVPKLPMELFDRIIVSIFTESQDEPFWTVANGVPTTTTRHGDLFASDAKLRTGAQYDIVALGRVCHQFYKVCQSLKLASNTKSNMTIK
uniref:Uncharacterized protein n=1 Tax=Clandestinovirus TaxID=2831644 RepID=A0A8F8PJW0_9VIRU|nr:hypothetical protein KOM_12_98 [Clandestinovirus]